MKKNTTGDLRILTVNALIYGKSGVGKTSTALTLDPKVRSDFYEKCGLNPKSEYRNSKQIRMFEYQNHYQRPDHLRRERTAAPPGPGGIDLFFRIRHDDHNLRRFG